MTVDSGRQAALVPMANSFRFDSKHSSSCGIGSSKYLLASTHSHQCRLGVLVQQTAKNKRNSTQTQRVPIAKVKVVDNTHCSPRRKRLFDIDIMFKDKLKSRLSLYCQQ